MIYKQTADTCLDQRVETGGNLLKKGHDVYCQASFGSAAWFIVNKQRQRKGEPCLQR